MLWTQYFLKLGQGHSDPKMVCENLLSQYAFLFPFFMFWLQLKAYGDGPHVFNCQILGGHHKGLRDK